MAHIAAVYGSSQSNNQQSCATQSTGHLHDLDLACCGEQLGQASFQALLADAYVFAPLCQQLDEGGQQLQVASWGYLPWRMQRWPQWHIQKCSIRISQVRYSKARQGMQHQPLLRHAVPAINSIQCQPRQWHCLPQHRHAASAQPRADTC